MRNIDFEIHLAAAYCLLDRRFILQHMNLVRKVPLPDTDRNERSLGLIWFDVQNKEIIPVVGKINPQESDIANVLYEQGYSHRIHELYPDMSLTKLYFLSSNVVSDRMKAAADEASRRIFDGTVAIEVITIPQFLHLIEERFREWNKGFRKVSWRDYVRDFDAIRQEHPVLFDFPPEVLPPKMRDRHFYLSLSAPEDFAQFLAIIPDIAASSMIYHVLASKRDELAETYQKLSLVLHPDTSYLPQSRAEQLFAILCEQYEQAKCPEAVAAREKWLAEIEKMDDIPF